MLKASIRPELNFPKALVADSIITIASSKAIQGVAIASLSITSLISNRFGASSSPLDSSLAASLGVLRMSSPAF
jgi:hypothetical protein